jgi:hypothetical protein
MKIRNVLLALAAALPALAGNRDIDTPMRIIAGNTARASAIFAADFTTDGKPDVLLVEPGKLRVLPGAATTLFGNPILTDLGDVTVEGLADFNRDGRPDLYLRTIHDGAAIMDGNANGTFSAQRTISVTYSAAQLVAGDFDGDTLLDLASAGGGRLVVYRGDGNGGFSSPYDIVMNTVDLRDLTAGDFDADGKLDLLAGTTYQNLVAWNSGTSFATAILDGGGRSVTAGDVNGDGVTDAIAWEGANARIWLGAAASRTLAVTTFHLDGSFDNVLTPYVTLARLDGDARADVLLAGENGITVLSHDGTNFRSPHTYLVPTGDTNAIATGDFTGDGYVDVVSRGELYFANPAAFGFTLVRGRGDGSLGAPYVFDLRTALSPDSIDWDSPLVTNVNGDAHPDLVFQVSFGDTIATLLVRSDGTFSAPVRTAVTPHASSWSRLLDASDLNADGRGDVIRHYSLDGGTQRFQSFFGQSSGSFVPGPISSLVQPAQGVVSIRDFTGDGRADILESSGRLYPGSGNGAFGAPISTNIDTWMADSVAIGDVNNDARPDVFVFGQTDVVWINDGGGSFTSAASPISAGPPALADINGDNVNDAVVSGGVMLGTGGGAFAPNYTFELDPGAPMVADFDGDGHRDVATTQMIYYGTGSGAFDDASQTSLEDGSNRPFEGALLSTADFDGNGSPDLWRFAYGYLTVVPTRTGTSGTVPTQVAASTNPDPSPWRERFDINAGVAASVVRPRGGVLFSLDGTPYAIKRVQEHGVATDTHEFLDIGSAPNFAVTFLGDEHYAGASASTSHTTTKGRTIVHINGPGSYQIGAPVSFTGSLARWSGTPTGTITYRKGDTILATRSTTAGQFVSITDRTLFPLGKHTLTATYSGDEFYAGSEESVEITITKVFPVMSLSLPASPVIAGQHTIGVTFPNHPSVTGTVTFGCFDTTFGTRTIVNAQASMSANIPAGEGSCWADYSGDAEYQPRKLFGYQRVYTGNFPAAPGIVASRTPGTSWTQLSIQPVNGASTYSIYRGINGSPFMLVTTTGTLSYSDYATLPPMTTAVYAAVAHDGSGASSAMGPRDIVTNVTFSDASLTGVFIKASHATELQSAINAVRRAAGLQEVAFGGPSVGSSVTFARLYAMRNALAEARAALGMPLTFSENTPTVIRAIHLEELRNAAQ